MPPPKIVGRGIQSKLIVQETGKRLYGSDLPYQEQMQKLTGKYVQDLTLVKQSEFKKPYLENSYPEMEHFQYPPGPDPIRPPGPGGFDNDCSVGYEAAGAVVGWRICAPSDDCAGWIFTCAHKIVSFTCGNCQIARMEQLSGDRVLVIICSKSDNLDVKFLTNDGETNTLRFGRTCLGTDPDPACVGSGCADCAATPVIGYTTQQMSTGGAGSTQNLNADGGGGGPYTWAIISGGGTLSKLKTTNNEMTTYTAPASNVNCVNNPTIQVTDYCGHTKTLKLAVNGGGTGTTAVGHSYVYSSATCQLNIHRFAYTCDGTTLGSCTDAGCGTCAYTIPGCLCSGIPCSLAPGCFGCCNTCPDPAGGLPTCVAGSPGPSQTCGCNGKSWSSVPGNYDVRTAEEKAGECCPYQLL